MRYFHPELFIFLGITAIVIMLLRRYGKPANMHPSFVSIFYGCLFLSAATGLDYADSYLFRDFVHTTFDVPIYNAVRVLLVYLPGVILVGIGIYRWFKLTAQLQDEIEARKGAEDRLKSLTEDYKIAAENALSSSRVKADFVRNMSHELRTPLNVIIGFSEIMQKEMFGKVGPDEYVEYLSHINKSGQKLLDIVNDVLDFSRSENNEIELVETDFDLSRTAHQALELMEFQIVKSGVTVTSEIVGGLQLCADERMVQQMIFNLVLNAVKFTKRGGNVMVATFLMPDDSCSVIVKDTGCGMTAAEIAHVVNPFSQVAGTLTRSHEGAGLGLTLVKNFIELHGGEMLIESQPQVGTSVCLKFPRDRVAVGLARSA
ncbi:MAG: HAMP domain-containing histidine kinase [Kordiimonadaceae bacterium]|nr:HAMP domain-containing histidine kinase [Kordiimonadaceae bacterium]